MDLNMQKRLAARVAGCSPKRIRFDTSRFEDIKDSITKEGIRGLLNDNAIIVVKKKGISRYRAKLRSKQRKKGRQRGFGRRKGRSNARNPRKRSWINRVRLQRNILKELKEKKIIENITFKMLYAKVKGGFFRSKRHLKLYINEHNLAKNKQ